MTTTATLADAYRELAAARGRVNRAKNELADAEAALADAEDAYAAAKAAPKAPALRINAANVGRVLTLGFHSPYNPFEQDAKLLKLEGEGDDARATFKDEDGMEWEAYRYNGRWAYGSSANRLQVLGVLNDSDVKEG
jgi:hypothetical protein